MNPDALIARARVWAGACSDERLAELIRSGSDGVKPEAWEALLWERDRRLAAEEEAQRAASPNRWGTIGWRKSVELGIGVGVGFGLVSLLGWAFAMLLRLVQTSAN